MKNKKQNATNSSEDLMANNLVKNQVQDINKIDRKEILDINYLLNNLEKDLRHSQSLLSNKPYKHKEYNTHLFNLSLLKKTILTSIRLPYIKIQNIIKIEYAKDRSLTGAIINLNWKKPNGRIPLKIDIDLWKK